MLKHITHALTLNIAISIAVIAIGHLISYLFG